MSKSEIPTGHKYKLLDNLTLAFITVGSALFGIVALLVNSELFT